MTVPAKPVGPHVPVEAIHAALASPSRPESDATLAHVATCADCSLEAARVEAFLSPESVSDRARDAAWKRFVTGERPTTSLGPPRALLALAATLVLAVGAAVLVRVRTAPSGGEARGVSTPTPDIAVEGLLDAAPVAFPLARPAGEPGAVRVVVFDAERRYEWWSEPSKGTTAPFPASERAKLRPGVVYYWSVVVGSRSGEARTFQIRR